MRDSILVRGLGKRFSRLLGGRPSSLKEAVLSGFRRKEIESFWALRNVSFGVGRGRTVGVVGKNGSGKSTLLRLIGGVGKPTEGEIEVHGRIGALLDLGAGLTDDLTGLENIFIAGVISGMTRDEVRARCDDIIAFAELDGFIEMPIRTYSSGMRMRLAFSVAVHTTPDILLIDEVLAVGDAAFQRKCLERIARIKESGCTIFLVSHDESQIRALCDEALLLSQGRLIAHGSVSDIMRFYETGTTEPIGDPGAEVATFMADDEGARGAAMIEAVRILHPNGGLAGSIVTGAPLRMEADVLFRQDVPEPKLALTILAEDGTPCLDTNSESSGLYFPVLGGRQTMSVALERIDLQGGRYRIEIGLYAQGWGPALHRHEPIEPLLVVGPRTGRGFMNPPLAWSVRPRG
jgi:lipopolysaccharide transport system ATP-binding protein